MNEDKIIAANLDKIEVKAEVFYIGFKSGPRLKGLRLNKALVDYKLRTKLTRNKIKRLTIVRRFGHLSQEDYIQDLVRKLENENK